MIRINFNFSPKKYQFNTNQILMSAMNIYIYTNDMPSLNFVRGQKLTTISDPHLHIWLSFIIPNFLTSHKNQIYYQTR